MRFLGGNSYCKAFTLLNSNNPVRLPLTSVCEKTIDAKQIYTACELVKECTVFVIKGYAIIQGSNRHQTYFITLEDQVGAGNPVRLIVAFIDKLDLQKLGFSNTIHNSEGRPPYAPAVLLKLYLYGYLNKIRSRRKLEKECIRNTELQWLLQSAGRLRTCCLKRKVNGLLAQCVKFTHICFLNFSFHMKKFLLPLLLLFVIKLNAQLLSFTPDFIQEASTPVTITTDAGYGNQGLLNYTPTPDVYVHIGVVTNLSGGGWAYSKFEWGTANAAAQCTYLGANKWKYIITGGLRNFFGITNASEKIQKIAILFRNGNGTKVQRNRDGSDMYVPVYDNGLYARIDVPYRQPLFNPIPEPLNKNIGDQVSITVKSSKNSTLKILFNGTQVANSTGKSLSATTSITSGGSQLIVAKADSSTVMATDTMQFMVTPAVTVAPLPAGDTDGINYKAGDTSVDLVLYAPLKQYIYVLGDFNNWQISTAYLMKVTPDKKRFWIRIKGLKPGKEYAYQYLIDGTLKVADYNCEKILDPYNDQYISEKTFPNIKPYPTGKTTGIVSILRTAKPEYEWQVSKFTRPNKQNLVIYELLVRDFTAAGNFQTLIDTLSYLQRLGINAIEVMPFNEFEGNSSWGYNPSFYFAPDKAYGPEKVVKQFIDECHKRGIAVIMDMVLNHSFGQSPMVQMYWDNALGVPAANNPWFNQYAKHAYNVGYDFNHESTATQDFVHRVIDFWLKNYKIDGFRWDLAKGFTQKQTCDATGNNCNESVFSAYDANRIATWKKYYDYMQSASLKSYSILEMFADNSEEKVESDYGMMLWGNSNYTYNQATMGYKDGWDFSWGIYSNRGWAEPNLITYQESHDEERLMYKNEQYGAASGTYNVKNIPAGLARNGMAAAFFMMQPGPKMIWEFGELGYDLSINRCTNGTVNNNCRLDPKPPKWQYYDNAKRKELYNVYADLIHLKTYPDYISTFINGTPAYNLSDTIKWQSLKSGKLEVMVFGNFGVKTKKSTVTFPSTGKWYNYLNTGTINLASAAYTVTLKPGAYYVYTNKNVRSQVLGSGLNLLEEKAGSDQYSSLQKTNIDNAIKYWNLYPNPAKNNTALYAPDNYSKAEIALRDLNGKIVYRSVMNNIVAGQQLKIPLQQLSKGVYVIQIITQQSVDTQELVVQ